MQCLIVDDDEMIRIDLEHRIKNMSNMTLVASCGTSAEAAGLLMSTPIDLIFLDIELPDMDGLQLLRTLPGKRPNIILVTSKKEMAAEAFDYDVTDFLLKPFTDERFMKAVMRASSQVQTEKRSADHLFVRVNSMLQKITMSDIQYVEALADYVQIQCAGQRYVVHSTMKSIEHSLPQSLFFRVHNSFIVNLEKISKIEDNMVVVGEKLIPVSRAKIKTLLQQINLLKQE